MASAPVSLRDLDQPLGDQRPRDRGAEQIDALIERIGAEHRKDEIADEFLAQILDVDLLDAEHLGLLARRLELLALAEIGGEGHDLGAIFGLQPFQDDRGVEPARIGEHDLLHACRASSLFCSFDAPVLSMPATRITPFSIAQVRHAPCRFPQARPSGPQSPSRQARPWRAADCERNL